MTGKPENADSMETISIEEIKKYHGFTLIWMKNVPVMNNPVLDLLANLAAHDINVNQLVQTTDKKGLMQITYTMYSENFQVAQKEIKSFCEKNNTILWDYRENITRIVLKGSGMKTHSQTAAIILEIFQVEEIPVYMIGSGEMSFSIYIDFRDSEKTCELLEKYFFIQP